MTDVNQALDALRVALQDVPALASTLERRNDAVAKIAALQSQRAAVTRYAAVLSHLRAQKQAVEGASRLESTLISLIDRFPSVDATLRNIEETSTKKAKSEERLRELKAELSSLESRAAECKRLLSELDSGANRLMDLQRNAAGIYADLNAVQELLRQERHKRDEFQVKLQALKARSEKSRELLVKVSGLEINESSVSGLDLTPLLDRGLSPIPLHSALLDKKFRQEHLAETRIVVRNFEAQKDQLSTLLRGSELVSKNP